MALFRKKERDYNPKYCQGGARDFSTSFRGCYSTHSSEKFLLLVITDHMMAIITISLLLTHNVTLWTSPTGVSALHQPQMLHEFPEVMDL